MATITLATTYHDPRGVLYAQLARLLPTLATHFAAIAVDASPEMHGPTLALLRDHGAQINQQARPFSADGVPHLGKARRDAVALALQQETPFVVYCDGDRILHWLDHYPTELATVLAALTHYDFTILGRTPRAFASHPRVQTETEAIINRLYTALSGREWDITAAARGLSQQAAQAIVSGCADDTIGVDASWPLFVAAHGGLQLGYIETEGLEFETAAQQPVAVAAAGGVEAWKATLDRDPQAWAFRLSVARVEVESMLPYKVGEV